MSGISLQQSANSVLVDSPTKKIKYPVSDSFLKTQESVKSKDSESVSIFPELGENNTALEIGAAILGTTALVLGARKCGVAKSLLSKLKINPFPLIEKNGFRYRQILGKKFNLQPNLSVPEIMTIPDKSLKSLRVKNLHPTNLRNELSRCNYTYSEVEDLLSWNPELSRTVGSLPNGWIKGVNADGLKAGLTAKNIRGKNAQNFREVDEVLSKFATKFHDVKDGNYPSIQQVQDQLSKILNTEVKIQKLGSGCIGTAYKISAHGQDCVYKVFFNTPLVQAPGSHGNYPELLSALQAKNNHCKNFADFYMGKFGRNDDGYLLTRYIPEAETVVKTPSGRPKLFSDLLKKMSGSELIGANARNGIGLDYGATYLTEYTKLSPKAQKIARELFPALDGTSSENVSRIVQRYTGTAELEEVKTYINTFIQQQYHLYPKLLASRKHNLEQLGLDYKTDLRWIFGRNTDPKGFAMDYGLTEKQIQKLDVMWSEAHQSDHSDIACKLSMSILRWD